LVLDFFLRNYLRFVNIETRPFFWFAFCGFLLRLFLEAFITLGSFRLFRTCDICFDWIILGRTFLSRFSRLLRSRLTFEI
jgi:hypothetical protein